MTVGSSNDNNGTIHVSSTSDHVFDVIGVTRAVDVGIVSVLGLELDVCGGDSDTTLALLRSLVNSTVFKEIGKTLGSLVLGNGSSQGSLGLTVRFGRSEGEKENRSDLAMIDVTDGTLRKAFSNHIQKHIYHSHQRFPNYIPMLTWGFDRSKVVASRRAATRSLLKTW